MSTSPASNELIASLVAAIMPLQGRLLCDFPVCAQAAAELELLCERACVNPSDAIEAMGLGLQETTILSDAQLWQEVGDAYPDFALICPEVTREHLRELLVVEDPFEVLVSLHLMAIMWRCREIPPWTWTPETLRAHIASEMEAGKVRARTKPMAPSVRRHTIRALATAASQAAVQWSADDRTTKHLVEAVRLLTTPPTPGDLVVTSLATGQTVGRTILLPPDLLERAAEESARVWFESLETPEPVVTDFFTANGSYRSLNGPRTVLLTDDELIGRELFVLHGCQRLEFQRLVTEAFDRLRDDYALFFSDCCFDVIEESNVLLYPQHVDEVLQCFESRRYPPAEKTTLKLRLQVVLEDFLIVKGYAVRVFGRFHPKPLDWFKREIWRGFGQTIVQGDLSSGLPSVSPTEISCDDYSI